MRDVIIIAGERGVYVGRFLVPDGAPLPIRNRGRDGRFLPRAERKYAIPGSHYEPGCEAWRWDRVTETWQRPTIAETVIDATGAPRRTLLRFPDEAIAIRAGESVVPGHPPNARARRPLYDRQAQAWAVPERYAEIDEATGDVINIITAPPGAPPPPAPPGRRREPARPDTVLRRDAERRAAASGGAQSKPEQTGA